VPADAQSEAQIWQAFDGAAIDFTVVPLMDAILRADDKLHLQLVSHLPADADAEVTLGDAKQKVRLKPEAAADVEFPMITLRDGETRDLPLTVVAGALSYQRKWQIKGEQTLVALAALPDQFQSGERVRGGNERPITGESSAFASSSTMSCGGVTKQAIGMHPPYRTGVGYTYALFDPVDLPAAPKAAFRCEIGKGDGSVMGDGILYRVAVVEPGGKETIVAEKQWAQHGWTPLEADLARWTGKRIQLKLIADVGPADNPAGDHAGWASSRIESALPVLKPKIMGLK
jgi:hypothetical protein